MAAGSERGTGAARYHAGRGLCQKCYEIFKYSGELIAFEPLTRTRDELMSDWQILRSRGCTKRQAADRLGMSFDSFNRAYERARAAGDQRAVAR